MATKLLLIEDVDDLGRSGDIVSVKEGYARNFLLPKKFGIFADKNALRRQAELQEARRKKAVADKAESDELAKALEVLVLSAEVKVDPEGHMYGSVTHQDILKLLHEQHGIELEKKFIVQKQPIKQTGTHRIELKLKEGVPAFFTLKINPEGVDLDAMIEEAKAANEEAASEEATDE